jgi:phage host-nuclease inhibitor protein Gam
MRYADLKKERDDAIARAVEAERLPMKSEFDRVVQECEREKARLLELASADKVAAYKQGFMAGMKTMSNEFKRVSDDLVEMYQYQFEEPTQEEGSDDHA